MPRVRVAAARACAFASPSPWPSLSSPKPAGRENIPVVHVPYKPGSVQMVRIALEAAAKTGTISSTGQWGMGHGDAQARRFEAAVEIPLDSLSAAEREGSFAEAREGSLITWNGKKYRGILRISGHCRHRFQTAPARGWQFGRLGKAGATQFPHGDQRVGRKKYVRKALRGGCDAEEENNNSSIDPVAAADSADRCSPGHPPGK